jgi:two-component system response regulator YesN
MFNIAIIDDEPWSREVVKALGAWDNLGLRIVGEAEDGSEGLMLIEELRPHVVVTDMRMPGLDGVGLLKTMNERFPALKIIVMSGYDDFAYLKQAIRSRAVEYLLKPIDQGELNAALARCVQEMKQASMTAIASWTMPFAFADAELLEQYFAYRQRVHGFLLDLNKQATLETLVKLEELLDKAIPEPGDGNRLAKIGHDFMLMLEEFASENDVTIGRSASGGASAKDTDAAWDTLAEAFGQIRSMYGNAIDTIEDNRRNRNRLDLAEVRLHIDRHFQHAISLETIAQSYFVSKEHLSRAFKSQFGENLTDYILRKRMEKARELIVEQKLAIKHVAQLTGYEDIAYFYRVFKKHFGQTPGDLRKDQ